MIKRLCMVWICLDTVLDGYIIHQNIFICQCFVCPQRIEVVMELIAAVSSWNVTQHDPASKLLIVKDHPLHTRVPILIRILGSINQYEIPPRQTVKGFLLWKKWDCSLATGLQAG